MSRRDKRRSGLAVPSAAAAAAGPARSRWRLMAGLVLAALVTAVLIFLARASAPPSDPALASAKADVPAEVPAAAAAGYVGAEACRTCHESEFKAWSGSHHQLAMQAATPASVLGNFDNARFTKDGVESTFFRRGDQFMVRTDGPDGRLGDYEIRYTFGVYPLQQYLIPFPGGRYQVLQIAWDARTKGEGGQRWFHLYPQQRVDHRDPLHWIGVYHNWALQCAECHSTHLRKGFDPASQTYQTTWSEINVGCEACHGPASAHVEQARRATPPYAAADDKTLPSLKTRWQEAWSFPGEGARTAVRDRPPEPAGMNSCAACHSRRSTLSEARTAGAVLEDSHRLALLMTPNYHADGQQHEEVYVWGSFLQSRMHQNGVTCMDCHEPHSHQLRRTGNALCTRCHAASEFDRPTHHHHQASGKGADCVTCHMPAQNYMVIHARQDHSLRLPRPDLSLSLGSPNACTQCHRDRQPQWAAAAMDRWYGKAWRERPHYGKTLHAARTQGVRALPDLLQLATSPSAAAIVRATAATLAQPYATPATLPAASALLQEDDPLLRIAALGLLASAEPAKRVLTAAPLLSDAVRGVRIEAANVLADIPDSQLPADRRAARQAAQQEYEATLALEADWPSGQVNLGNLRLRQGRSDEAVAAFERAISLDPQLSDAYINLADSWRQQGREAAAADVLRRGLAELPRDADLHHALGLLLVRTGQAQEAISELGLAARLAPDNARHAYVHAIAVHSAGQPKQALALLREAGKRHRNDVDILAARLSISRETGDARAALAYAKELDRIVPGDAALERLIAELEAARLPPPAR